MSQALATQLFEDEGIDFFGLPRRNMKNKLMRLNDKLLSLEFRLKNEYRENGYHQLKANHCKTKAKIQD